MRITNKMMANNYLRDMGNNLSNLNRLNGQLSSGKEIRKPSDDPFRVARAMQLHTDVNTNVQYNDNINDTINWLDATDTALNQLTNVVQRTRELMVSSGNAAYGPDEKKAINDEINQQVEQVAQILNTNFDGRYIFGGTRGTAKPVGTIQNAVTNNSELVYLGRDGSPLNADGTDQNANTQLNMIDGDLNVEISQGVVVNYNVNAMEILNFKGKDGKSQNFIELMSDITNNLQSKNPDDAAKVTKENLTSMDAMIQNLMKVRGEVGAKQNRMEAALQKNESENLNMKEILSKTEDIDFTQKTMEYSMAETVYTAALQTSAKVLPQTLMDYIR